MDSVYYMFETGAVKQKLFQLGSNEVNQDTQKRMYLFLIGSSVVYILLKASSRKQEQVPVNQQLAKSSSSTDQRIQLMQMEIETLKLQLQLEQLKKAK